MEKEALPLWGRAAFFARKKFVKKAKILAQRPAALYTKIEKKREGGGFLSVAERRNHDANVSRLWPCCGGWREILSRLRQQNATEACVSGMRPGKPGRRRFLQCVRGGDAGRKHRAAK